MTNDKKVRWINWLRFGGVKASHPDDGWHTRDKRYFQFSYPHFNEGVCVGDMVALGDPDSFIVVMVKEIKDPFIGLAKYYY